MLNNSFKKKLILPLLILVISASGGITIALYIAPGTIGNIIFSISKVILLLLPVLWFIYIDYGKINLFLPKKSELLVGSISGLLVFTTIISVYNFVGNNWIDITDVRLKAKEVGINSPTIYLFGVIYWSFFNSLIEEYIWRWFVYIKCEQLTSQKIAVFLSAIFFTLHHIIALTAYTPDIRMVILGSLGVFTGGVIWSFSYLKFRSLWSGYISHILADLAMAFIGWQLLFTAIIE